MKNIPTKANLSGGDDSGTATKFGAKELNSIADELENFVVSTGETPSPGTSDDPDTNMISRGITIASQTAHSYQDSGAADAYVLTRTGSLEQPGSYKDGERLTFVTSNQNAGASTVNVSSRGVKKILKPGNIELSPGDILPTIYNKIIYDSAADSAVGAYILENNEAPEIQTIGASVAANALTLTLSQTILDFRDNTLTSGTIKRRNSTAVLSLIVPSGATLGTIDTISSRLALLAIDNAGTIELAVVNLSGGNNIDETTLISTTAIDATADSANVFYSTTARTNVPFRVVGYVESTQATAGTWATAPSAIQGYGGQAFAAMSSFGYGQTWQNVSGSRSSGTTYYNTTGKSISVSINATSAIATLTSIGLIVGGKLINDVFLQAPAGGSNLANATAIIPHGSSYSGSISAASFTWFELR